MILSPDRRSYFPLRRQSDLEYRARYLIIWLCGLTMGIAAVLISNYILNTKGTTMVKTGQVGVLPQGALLAIFTCS